MGPTPQSTLMLHHTQPSQATKSSRRILLYLITGNPGLIGYYSLFLSHLTELLTKTYPANSVVLAGQDLAGFGTSPTSHPSTESSTSTHASPTTTEPGTPPFGLDEQIRRVQSTIAALATDPTLFGEAESQAAATPQAGKLGVVLVGHSVGSYILLEVLSDLQRRACSDELFEILAGICLFPTVTHIARSPSGRKLTVSPATLNPTTHHPSTLHTRCTLRRMNALIACGV